MRMEIRRFTGSGIEVKPGARDRHRSNRENLAFTFWTVCDSVDPDRWHGEVMFGSTVLLITEPATNTAAAGRLAEDALEAKITALFGEAAGG